MQFVIFVGGVVTFCLLYFNISEFIIRVCSTFAYMDELHYIQVIGTPNFRSQPLLIIRIIAMKGDNDNFL